jgi:hypothetical protein
MIEHAVFSTIFENVSDEPGFERAIKESLPDEKHFNELQDKIKRKDQKLLKLQMNLIN